MRLLHRLLALLLAFTGAVVVTTVATPAAHATNGCSGNPTQWIDFNDTQGYYVAQLDGYSLSNGGYCVALASEGRYRGVAKYMSLKICDDLGANCHSNAGNFLYYAGPVDGPFCMADYLVIHNPSGSTILNSHGFFGSCE